MDKTAVVKVGAAASASVCALFGGVVLAQYIVAKKKRAGKKTRIIEMYMNCYLSLGGGVGGRTFLSLMTFDSSKPRLSHSSPNLSVTFVQTRVDQMGFRRNAGWDFKIKL
eukprot:superscaffoldBa00008761_g23608